MNEYHKIQTLFKRDPKTNYKTLLNEYSKPEFEYLKDNLWVFTEKVDGMNWRIKFNGTDFEYAGKTDKAQLPGDLVNTLNLHIHSKITLIREIFGNAPACLYGEGYGAGIQKGGIYRKDKAFVLFDVMINNCWLKRTDVQDIAIKLGVNIVPFVGYGSLQNMVELVKLGFKSHWGNFIAEGIVARPAVELVDRYGKRIITKLKDKDFK